MNRLLPALSRTKRSNADNRDRCPHSVKPIAGFVDDSNAVCTRAEAKVQLSQSTATTSLTFFYALDAAVRSRFVLPLSEFGRVSSYEVTIDGRPVEGQVLKRGASNTIWTSDSQESPPIFGFVSSMDLPAGKKATVIVARIVSAVVTDKHELLCFGLPYTCLPRAPSDIQLDVKMDNSIRAISTPNRHHKIYPVIRGKRAQVHVDLASDAAARTAEYLFIVQVEIGPPIRPECADPVALLILTSAAAAMLFYGLTNSVVEDF